MTPQQPAAELIIEHGPGSSKHKVSLVVRLADRVLHADEVHITDAADRQRFIEQLCTSRPGIAREEVESELLAIAGSFATPDAAGKPSQATKMVELAADVKLFHDPDDEAYATARINDRLETLRINSKLFRRWLRQRFWEVHRTAPNSQTVQDALGVLEGKALFQGLQKAVFVRLAGQDNTVWLDLANTDREVVEIGSSGWRIIGEPPVNFWRPPGMLPLPKPVLGGSLELLRPFLNLQADEDWILVMSWLVGSLRPKGPYPILTVNGEQGAAKSTACRVLRALVDPHAAALRAEPRETRDLMITARNNRVLAFDNLSHIAPWLSDALCRLATGGAFGTRALYTDAEEILFSAQRPVMLNGIPELATRGDLLDRAICITLPAMAEDRRRTEERFWAEFEERRPGILGALLDAVSAALRNIPHLELPTVPRMADFAYWVAAAEEALPWEPGTFLKAYLGNRTSAHDLAIEATSVGPAIQKMVVTRPGLWSGTASDLLSELETHHVDEKTARRRDWPRSPQALSNVLRRITPDLRNAGITISMYRETGANRRRVIELDYVGNDASEASLSSETTPTHSPPGAIPDASDDRDDLAATLSGEGWAEV